MAALMFGLLTGWSLPLVDLMPMLPTGVTPANFFLM